MALVSALLQSDALRSLELHDCAPTGRSLLAVPASARTLRLVAVLHAALSIKPAINPNHNPNPHPNPNPNPNPHPHPNPNLACSRTTASPSKLATGRGPA